MALTIEKYLQVIPNLVFPEDFIARIIGLPDIAITSGTTVDNITQAKLDLAESEVWYGASGMVSGGGYSKRINNRQISENQITITDAMRDEWLERCNILRDKLGLSRYSERRLIHDVTTYW